MSYRSRLIKIGDALKRVEYRLTDHQRKISYAEKRIAKLKVQKDGLAKLVEKYPEARYSNGDLYLEGMRDNWDKVAGMSIESVYERQNYKATNLAVKFSLNKKYSEGLKIFMIPENGVIAQIITEGYGKTAKGTIKIFDYKSIIPDTCPRRKAFIRRIKYNLLDKIVKKHLTIQDDSFDKDDFVKLMLLK